MWECMINPYWKTRPRKLGYDKPDHPQIFEIWVCWFLMVALQLAFVQHVSALPSPMLIQGFPSKILCSAETGNLHCVKRPVNAQLKSAIKCLIVHLANEINHKNKHSISLNVQLTLTCSSKLIKRGCQSIKYISTQIMLQKSQKKKKLKIRSLCKV